MNKIYIVFLIAFLCGCDKTITFRKATIRQPKNSIQQKQLNYNNAYGKNKVNNKKEKIVNIETQNKDLQYGEFYDENDVAVEFNENQNVILLNKALNKNSIPSALAEREKRKKGNNIKRNIENNNNNNKFEKSINVKTFKIQCGNFSNIQVAQELVDKLKSNGIENVNIISENGTNKVVVGSFQTKEDGAKTREELKKLDFIKNEFWVYN